MSKVNPKLSLLESGKLSLYLQMRKNFHLSAFITATSVVVKQSVLQAQT
jgi:hypothetical protein